MDKILKKPFSKIELQLALQTEEIAKEIIDKKIIESADISLLGGKTGITLLFAYLAKAFSEKNYLQTTFDYLDIIGESLSNEELFHNMSSGVAGIAFVFQHLRNMGVLDKAEDLNLAELDEFIDKGIDVDFEGGNWDPLHGMVGLGIYFLERNKENSEKKYLEKITDRLYKMRVKKDEFQVWVTAGYRHYSKDNYNFGMAHGMPGIISFLSQVYQRGIRQNEIEEMIDSCIRYILKNKYADDPLYSFPGAIEVNSGIDSKEYCRLGWCYGDLCVANALLHCGNALQNKNWIDEGISIAEKTTRRNFENSRCMDASFCHGSAGLAHQYNRLYQFTGNDIFNTAKEFWINTTLQKFYKPGEGVGGYYYNRFNEEKNISENSLSYGLLEGSAGIGLVYLSLIYDIKPDWDIIFLTNV